MIGVIIRYQAKGEISIKNDDLLEKLSLLIKISDGTTKADIYFSKSYSNCNLYVNRVDGIEFEKVIDTLWRKNDDVFNSITLNGFKQKLLDYYVDKINNYGKSEFSIKDIYDEIKSVPKQTWEVFKPIHGCELKSKHEPITFGKFTVYSYKNHKGIIENKYPHSIEILEHDLNIAEIDLLICVKVENRNADKAGEVAANNFTEFENIFRFIIGEQEHFNVSINESHFRRANDTYILSDEKMHTRTKYEGIYSLVPIDDPFFLSEEYGYSQIWEMMMNERLSTLKKQILMAINWVGKGLKEQDPTNSLIQYVFALESLFTSSSGGQLVSPSIAYQLAERAAFVTEKTAEERKECVKRVKDLYSLRSKVAHGRSYNLDRKQASEAFRLMKNIIIIMITHPELKDLDNIDEVQKWIDNLKYS